MVGLLTLVNARLPLLPVSFSSPEGTSPGGLPGQRSITSGASAARPTEGMESARRIPASQEERYGMSHPRGVEAGFGFLCSRSASRRRIRRVTVAAPRSVLYLSLARSRAQHFMEVPSQGRILNRMSLNGLDNDQR